MTPRTFEPTVYQTFTVKTDPSNVAPRLKALRAELKTAGLDAFLIPRADAHRGESVPPGEARLAYVTGFTGSAGIAVVGLKKAGLFIDSRYVIQAPAQTDTKHVNVHLVPQASLSGQIADYVTTGGRIGYDPWLHTPSEIRDLTEKLGDRATLVPSPNLVDRIWPDRPAAPVSPIEFLGHNRAGKTPQDKLADLRKVLGEDKADAAVLTLPESICWLFNMRARDVPNTPFVLGFAIIPRTGQPTVYLDKKKITADVRKGLAGVAKLADATTLPAALRQLGAADKRVLLDPATAPVAIMDAIKGVSDAVIIEKRDPVLMAKATQERRRDLPACARPTASTASRWQSSSAGSTRKPPRAPSTRSASSPRSKPSAARRRRSSMSASTPSRAPAPTAPATTTASMKNRTAS